MIKNFIFKGAAAKQDLKTYRMGLYQAKAYRTLKQQTALLLKETDISSLDWALLGSLSETKDGLKLGQTAELLGVEAPFVTVVVENLEKKGLIKKVQDKVDKRARVITLSSEGKKIVTKVEATLQKNMKKLLKGTSTEDVLGYLAVLKAIMANDPTAPKPVAPAA